MKRAYIWAVAAVTAIALLVPARVQAISAKKAIVLDGATGRVLYERQADSRSLIASTTKIMTALVVCQNCNVLDRVRIPQEAVGIEGSSMYLKAGEVLTVQELLYGLMLRSGNDAAVALAIYCGGTVEGFAELMNDKARVLGLEDTHFVNPHGLDAPGHYSTAADLAVLAAYAMEQPVFAMTVSTKTVTVGQRQLRNHNKLLWQYPDADGVKTGYTKAAGRLLVSSAQRSGRRLVAVTIDAPSDWQDHKSLLDRGFEEYRVEHILLPGERLGQWEVSGGQAGSVGIFTAEGFSYPLRKGEQVSILVHGPGFVYAPVSEGSEAGFVHVLVDGSPVGKVELIFGETVKRPPVRKQPWYKKLLGWHEG